ncbi:glycerate kinase [Mycolicibacterium hippocampi]|uniref:Glycerate kinase n=1 Tax=Mycolicibacterium hippocampi TaxID=659824 RepID=A0A850PNL8_9MYCO|nr:Glycerate kinase [Mycolicibacterium hippocampi]
MRVLIAPDKFKGSLSAAEVAAHLASGLADAGVDSDMLPLADGGDGSIDAAAAAGFSRVECSVRDALGRRHRAAIAIRQNTAVVELAGTCGLATLPPGQLAPIQASSHGFGEALVHAVRSGARTLVLALGGSASTDGGVGMLAALGFQFRDDRGRLLDPSAGNLGRIHTVDSTRAVDLEDIDVVVATDVISPLLGGTGAAAVFGPQKGATGNQIAELEAGLRNFTEAARRSGWTDAEDIAVSAGAGAAGGCGFAAALLGADLVSGADFFLDLLGFDHHLSGTDMVITGEGRLDDQTLAGKLPAAVLQRAALLPVVAVVGRDELRSDRERFVAIHAVADLTDVDTASDRIRTSELLRVIGARIGRSLPLVTQRA